ncbi:hypothetical protein [Rhodanobacter glycinis]|uniref:hypothetical protein n=1 Tax=Rhodanobacter glycinis TaxID=582702 RepID=UPI00112B71C0|nr:hypothetical protein [Rhodanobacter glycinis]
MTDRELLREQWRAVAEALKIEFIGSFCIDLERGQQHEFACLLPQFGGGRGMLIDIKYVPDAFSAAINAGFACSSMLAETHNLAIDPADYIDCLVDWTWSVQDQAPPGWYASAV